MSEGAFFCVEGLCKNFGGLAAVSDLSFQVNEREIRGLIGPNGAGKTTIFNVISGFYRPSAGRVIYQGKNIAGLNSHQIAQQGIVRTFQATTLFQEFTALKSVIVGRYLHTRSNMWTALFGTARSSERINEERAIEILEFLGLADRRDELAANLPHGLQRALGIAIALAAEPTLLLLDEPFAGMNPEETRHMMSLIAKVRERGITILLVEHDMKAVMGLCDRITVVNFGRLLAEGSRDEIRSNKDVIEAYLGAGKHAAPTRKSSEAAREPTSMLLEVKGIDVHYQKIAALQDVSLKISPGEIITLIGANGAGKSTILRTISGLKHPTKGEIWFDGKRIDSMHPDRIVRLGIAHVLEGRRVFPDLTVEENLRTGAYLRKDSGAIGKNLEEVYAHFPILKERRSQRARTLSGGEQQMLAMGRALMTSPRVLLMDEPSLGLSPIMVEEIATIIREVNRRGIPVILVEQNAELALSLARYGYVLETGRVALEGPASDLHENDHVRDAYLGA